MIDIALKNVFRQKVRSLLTILGIAMGIGLIISLGAIGEGLNRQIQSSFGDIAGVLDVRATDSDDGISEDIIEGLTYIEGISEVIPVGSYRITRSTKGMSGMSGRMMMMGGGGSSMSFTGIYPEDEDYLIGELIAAEQGRKLDESDDGETVVLLGATTAENQMLNIGDEIEYEWTDEDDKDNTETYYFEVVGILEETGDSTIDDAAYVSLITMQAIEEDDTIQSLKVKIDDVNSIEEIV